MSKPGILTWIDENWQSIECQFYGGVQQGAFNAAVGSAFTGKIPLALGLAGVSYAAAKTAEMAGCNYQPPEPPPSHVAGCKKIKDGWGELWMNSPSCPGRGCRENSMIVELVITDIWENDYGETIVDTNNVYAKGKYPNPDRPLETYTQEGFYKVTNWRDPWFTIDVIEGSCEVPATPELPPHNPGDPIADPITHTDGDCNWTIQATDAYVDDQGVWHTYYVITADNDACGGPFAYWSTGQGPDWVSPNPPDPDAPDTPKPPLPPRDYNPRFDDIDDDLDKVQEELEKLKECACPENPVQEGEYRTISFRSDETSPFGKSCLRKRFKYRSQSGLDLGAVVAHWRDFEFAAGPVTVHHYGSALGSPQVWAASIDEGKRVIRHAGGEAGIDPDQVGKWAVGGSDNARYGVSGQMKVDTTGGYYWITARDGSDGMPIVARVYSDP